MLAAEVDGEIVRTVIEDSRSLLTPHSAPFVEAILELGKTRDVSLLCVYGDNVKMLHPKVLSDWLGPPSSPTTAPSARLPRRLARPPASSA